MSIFEKNIYAEELYIEDCTVKIHIDQRRDEEGSGFYEAFIVVKNNGENYTDLITSPFIYNSWIKEIWSTAKDFLDKYNVKKDIDIKQLTQDTIMDINQKHNLEKGEIQLTKG